MYYIISNDHYLFDVIKNTIIIIKTVVMFKTNSKNITLNEYNDQ